MDAAAAHRFAEAWIAAWNRRDLEAILAHFADDAEFVSPRAAKVTGNAFVRGQAALRDYWSRRSAEVKSLHFELERTLWDARETTLTVVYVSTVDGNRVRACEFMRFDAAGRVRRGEAMYGAVL